MNSEQFAKIFDEQMHLCSSMLFKKAKEYATDDDRMHNFNAAAGLTGKTPVQALQGFLLKHTVSLNDMMSSDDPTYYTQDQWTEKISDSINYLILLQALLAEAYEALPIQTERDTNT